MCGAYDDDESKLFLLKVDGHIKENTAGGFTFARNKYFTYDFFFLGGGGVVT